MSKMRKPIYVMVFALISAISLTACGGGSSTPEESFIEGSGAITKIDNAKRKAAPALSGMTLSGKTFIFNPGQVAVVNVWASWCAPCRAEAPVLQEFSINYPQVQFAGILTRDNLSSARAFYETFNLTFPTFIDDSLLIGFGGSLIPNAIPTTLIIDRDGKVAVRISGEVTVAGLKKMLDKVIAND